MTKTLTKELATMEDLAAGVGTVGQTRASGALTLGKIDQPYAVQTVAAVKALDITKFTKARLYTANNYIDLYYDSGDATGLSSDVGAGSWFVQGNTFVASVALALYTAINGGVWEVGKSFTSVNQFMIYQNVAYKPKTTTSLPYVSLAAPDTAQVEAVSLLNFLAYSSLDKAKIATGQLGDIVMTAAYREGSTKGGKLYKIVAGGTGTADGGGFIDKTDGSGYQLQALFPNGVYASQFGAYCDGSAADDSYINAALYYVRFNNHGAETKTNSAWYVDAVQLDTGKYRLDNTIAIAQTEYNMRITAPHGKAVLYANTLGVQNGIDIDNVNPAGTVEISNIDFLGFNYGIYGATSAQAYVNVYNCRFVDCTIGIGPAVSALSVQGCQFQGAQAIATTQGNSVSFRSCAFDQTSGSTTPLFTVKGSLQLIDCYIFGRSDRVVDMSDEATIQGGLFVSGGRLIWNGTFVHTYMDGSEDALNEELTGIMFVGCTGVAQNGGHVVKLMDTGAATSYMPNHISLVGAAFNLQGTPNGYFIKTQSGNPPKLHATKGYQIINIDAASQTYLKKSGLTNVLVEAGTGLEALIPPGTKVDDVQFITNTGTFTADASKGSIIDCTSGSAAVLSAISNGWDGQIVTIISRNTNLSLDHASGAAGELKLSPVFNLNDFYMTADQRISLQYDEANDEWRELWRSADATLTYLPRRNVIVTHTSKAGAFSHDISSGQNVVRSNNTVVATMTNITGALYDGMEYFGIAINGNLTYQNEAGGAGELVLAGSVNYTPGATDTLHLMYDLTTDKWYEIARSNN